MELVLDHLPRPAQSLRLLEVGPGTGAVSLALLSETERTTLASITCMFLWLETAALFGRVPVFGKYLHMFW